MHSKVFSLTIDDHAYVPTMDDVETAIRLLDKHGITYFGYPSKEQGDAILITLADFAQRRVGSSKEEIGINALRKAITLKMVSQEGNHTRTFTHTAGEWLSILDRAKYDFFDRPFFHGFLSLSPEEEEKLSYYKPMRNEIISYLRETGMLRVTAEAWIHVHEFEWLEVVPKDKIHTSDYFEGLPVFDISLPPTQAFWRWFAKYHRDIIYDEEPLHLSWYSEPPERAEMNQRFFIINEIHGDTIPGNENSWHLSYDFEKDYAALIQDLSLAFGKKIRVDDVRI